MSFPARTVDGIDIVNLSGRLDAANAHDVKDQLKGLIHAGAGKVLIDLAQLKFLDSSGISVLVWAMKESTQRGGRIGLCRVPATVRSLLELTRLHRVFDTFEDEATACQALQATH